ncbi:MAG: hypothetical protein WC909_03675, partial [Candidatus Paceibacterota bacterium]
FCLVTLSRARPSNRPARLFFLPEKHDPAVRFLDVSKAVCLLLRANKKATKVVFLFAVYPEQNPNFFPKQS